MDSHHQNNSTNRQSKLTWNSIYTGEASDYKAVDEIILQFLTPLKPGSVLDVGCGAGNLCIPLAEAGWRVTGIDITEKAIIAAGKAASKKGLKVDFIQADASEWEPTEQYDLVTSVFSVPPDIEKRHQVYTMIRRATKPGGIIFFVIGVHNAEQKNTGPESFFGYESLNIDEIKNGLSNIEILLSETVSLKGHHHGKTETEHGEKPAMVFMVKTS